MTRRFLISSLAVGLLALGGLNARASEISLIPPAPLNTLEGAGNFAIVGNLEFSNFGYVVSPSTAPPPASEVNVSPFTSVPGEPGITFNGTFFAAAGTQVDYAISYTVTSRSGGPITDAYLSVVGGNFSGTGQVSVVDSFFTTSGSPITTFEASIPGIGSNVATAVFPSGYTTIRVQKDMILVGGSNGATVSFINQGFSVPEPTSMALLGIGLSGLFTLRRFFKRTSVA